MATSPIKKPLKTPKYIWLPSSWAPYPPDHIYNLSAIDLAYSVYGDALRVGADQVIYSMVSQYSFIVEQLENEIQDYATFLMMRHNAGEVITEQMILKMDSYNQLLSEAVDMHNKYATQVTGILHKGVQESTRLGIELAGSMMNVVSSGYQPVSDWAWQRMLNDTAVETWTAFLSEDTQSPLYELLNRDYSENMAGLSEKIALSVARGDPTSKIVDIFHHYLQVPLTRSVLIAQTEMARAYRTASIERYRRSGVVRAMKRIAKKNRACFACLMLDGLMIPMEEFTGELDDHPRGNCGVIPVVNPNYEPTWETGKTYFLNLDQDKQIEIMGQKRYEMWRSAGGADRLLDKLIEITHDRTWGGHPRILNLDQTSRILDVSIPKGNED